MRHPFGREQHKARQPASTKAWEAFLNGEVEPKKAGLRQVFRA